MIELNDVTFTYTVRGREVLSHVDVRFAEGMVHGLLGRNGAGKTTLLKIVCGLLAPKSGAVRVDGKDPMRRTPSQLQRIFLVPEEFDLPSVSLETFASYTAPFYPAFDRNLFESHCRALEVNRSSRLDTLSMGERKKSYIAFALACRTPYLLMDEPTNGLDIPSKVVFRRLLAAHADAVHALILSTHQVADLEKLIDNVVILDERGIALNATTRRIEERLVFGPLHADDVPLYSHEDIRGEVGVYENRRGQQTATDLTLLFGAVLANREKIGEIMNR